MGKKKLRVMVVDDSVIYRKVVRDVLGSEANVEVVGTAGNGRDALNYLDTLKPDVMTLDLEMPELDGMEVLRELKKRQSNVASIMITGASESAAELTTQALANGAYDFVVKPSGQSIEENVERLRRSLLPLIDSLGAEDEPAPAAATVPAAAPVATAPITWNEPPEVIAIGISTGGPEALHRLLPELPSDLPVPIVIVQHMPPVFTRKLAEGLDDASPLHVQEAAEGMTLEPGNVYIAPGGKQMKVARGAAKTSIQITDDAPERNCRPSVDYLFRSLADTYQGRVLAVIMTGMGNDGQVGCEILKKQGARILAQDANSCVVYGMPRCVVEAGLAHEVCPLTTMATKLTELTQRGALCS